MIYREKTNWPSWKASYTWKGFHLGSIQSLSNQRHGSTWSTWHAGRLNLWLCWVESWSLVTPTRWPLSDKPTNAPGEILQIYHTFINSFRLCLLAHPLWFSVQSQWKWRNTWSYNSNWSDLSSVCFPLPFSLLCHKFAAWIIPKLHVASSEFVFASQKLLGESIDKALLSLPRWFGSQSIQGFKIFTGMVYLLKFTKHNQM